MPLRTTTVGLFLLFVLAALCLGGCDEGDVGITPRVVPNGQVGEYYGVKFRALGGTAPIKWRLAAGNVPTGLRFSKGRRYTWLDGVPTTVGTWTFTLQAEDSRGNKIHRTYNIVIHAALVIVTNTLPDGELGQPYSVTLQAEGGSQEDYVWTFLAGALPTGLQLSSDGVLSGTPTLAGEFEITVKLADSIGNQVNKTFQLTIAEP